MNKEFNCKCDGTVRVIDDTHVSHACNLKYSHGTSYYDGVDKFMPYERTQIDASLTNGEPKYNWFFKWQ